MKLDELPSFASPAQNTVSKTAVGQVGQPEFIISRSSELVKLVNLGSVELAQSPQLNLQNFLLQIQRYSRTLAATQIPSAEITQMNPNQQQLQGIIAAAVGLYAFIYLIQAVIFIIPTWFISKKAGMSPWLSLLCLFPLTGVILLYILAFAEWKVIPAPQVGYQIPPPYPPQPPFPPQA
jgi:hypothetical protein